MKSLKSNKKKLPITSFYYVSQGIWLGNSRKKIFAKTNKNFTVSRTSKNWKIFNITSKHVLTVIITSTFVNWSFNENLCVINSLREKCPNMEIFLFYIFLYSVQIQENIDQKKLRIWTLFTQWLCQQLSHWFSVLNISTATDILIFSLGNLM